MGLNEDFEEFAVAIWPRLNRSAQMLGLSLVDAEEAAQAALASCFVRWKKLNRLADSPTAYCLRALLNQHKSRGRRNREHLFAVVPDAMRLEVHEVDNGASGAVLEALGTLSVAHRAVIVCRYYLDLSEADTAAVLDIPTGTAKSRTHRALALLEERISERANNDDS